MTRVLLVILLCAPGLAAAEEPAPALTPPPVVPGEAEVAQVPGGFLDAALKVSTKNEITEGRTARPLTHRQLFERLGRTDLVTESLAREQRRLWFAITGGALAVVGAAVGAVIIATGPKLASPECEATVQIYNEICVPRAYQHNIAGTAIIATGVVAGALMATLSYWSDPRVLDRDQTTSLVSSYNAQLAKRLKQPPSGWKVVPVITPTGAAVAASLRF